MVSVFGVTKDNTVGGVINYADWAQYDQSNDPSATTIAAAQLGSAYSPLHGAHGAAPTKNPQFMCAYTASNYGFFDSFVEDAQLFGGDDIGAITGITVGDIKPALICDGVAGGISRAATGGIYISGYSGFDTDTTYDALEGDCRPCAKQSGTTNPLLTALFCITNNANPKLRVATATIGRSPLSLSISYVTALSLLTTTDNTSSKLGRIDANNFVVFHTRSTGGIYATKVNWDGTSLSTVGTTDQNLNSSSSLTLLGVIDDSDSEWSLIYYDATNIKILPVKIDGSNVFSAGTAVTAHSWTGSLNTDFVHIGGDWFVVARHNGTNLVFKVFRYFNNEVSEQNSENLAIGATTTKFAISHANDNNLALLYEDNASGDFKFQLLIP